jgi:hypothetical protein
MAQHNKTQTRSNIKSEGDYQIQQTATQTLARRRMLIVCDIHLGYYYKGVYAYVATVVLKPSHLFES